MEIKLSNSLYDILKKLSIIILPGVAVLYASIAGIWHWGYIEEVAGTIAAVEVFIGVLIEASCKTYKAGDGE